MFDAGGRVVAVLVPGDREVSEKKLEAVLPRGGPSVRRRGVRGARVREGVRRPAGVRRRRDRARRPFGARRRSTGSRARTSDEHHVTGANVDRDFRVDGWDDLVAIREGDRCPIDGGELLRRPLDRGGAHLPARHEVLGAARDRVPGRGRVVAPLRDGLLRDRDLADRGGRGGAAPRRRRHRVAEGPGARSRWWWCSRPATTKPRSPRPSGSTPSSRARGVDVLLDDRSRARRGEVRRRRPDRLPGPGHGGQARDRGGHGGPEAPRDRGALDGASGRGRGGRGRPCSAPPRRVRRGRSRMPRLY